MPSSLQEIIQQYSTEPPVYSSGSEVNKLNQISDTLLGKNTAGQKLQTEISNLADKVNTLLKSPLPGSTPSYAPTATAEQNNESSSTPSFSRK